MKRITLAKARKLDKEIGNVLNTQLKTNFKISKFKNSDDLKIEYAENFSAFDKAYSDLLNLCSFKFELREKIQQLNNHEISSLLTLRQKLSATMTIITNIVYAVDDSVELGSSDVVIIDAKMKKESDNSYHTTDTVDYTVINRDMINEMERNVTFLRGEISGIDDELLMLNNSTTLEISDDTIKLLDMCKIIV